MINLGMSIFELAGRTLHKTGQVYSMADIIDLSVKIRHQLDIIERNRKTAETKRKKK